MPHSLVYKRIRKKFGGKPFYGTVVSRIPGPDRHFHVKYDDGDSEDLSEDDAFRYAKSYRRHMEKMKTQGAPVQSPVVRIKQEVHTIPSDHSAAPDSPASSKTYSVLEWLSMIDG